MPSRLLLLAAAVVVSLSLGCAGALEELRPIDRDATVMVIVGARDLYPGVTITEEDLYAIEIPVQLLPDGVFLSPEHVVGRKPRQRILNNEFIRSERLSSPEDGLSTIIPRGMRAVEVQTQITLPGPGSYVDIWVGAEPGCILAEEVFVLRVNGEKRPSDTPTKSVTLLMEPKGIPRLMQSPDARLVHRPDGSEAASKELLCSP